MNSSETIRQKRMLLRFTQAELAMRWSKKSLEMRTKTTNSGQGALEEISVDYNLSRASYWLASTVSSGTQKEG
jgi:hypothetical protein